MRRHEDGVDCPLWLAALAVVVLTPFLLVLIAYEVTWGGCGL